MCIILVDHARSKLRDKRSGQVAHLTLDEVSNMSPERWRRIDQLFQGAADLPPAERSAYLDGARPFGPSFLESGDGSF